ncbi:MAG TPA: twin-arginine translocation signal domain-containing protein [Candidatus Saccharimonadales bacterium]|nr:twin-arginine translocation signal domain-containing protein [Candidatus Saccharimonadales bacterium]
MLKNELHNLFNKPMDRRGFLKHVGVGVVAVTGAAALVKSLNEVAGSGAGTARQVGYGASAYGGQPIKR